MTGIYCITNTVNGKKYVGQSIDVEKRWKHHKNDCLNSNILSYWTYFYQALRKYGPEQFNFEVIEECPEDKLNEREIYWIKTLQSNNRELGYNTTGGGDGVKGYWDKPIYQYDLEGNFITEYKSVSEAKRQTGITSVGCACIGITKSGGGYMWSYTKADKIPKYVRGHRTTKIHQYSLDGKYIQSFSSILEASESTGIAYDNINSCVHSGRQGRAGSFVWAKEKRKSLSPYKRGSKTTPIRQLDLNGNIIAQFDSIKAASKVTSVNKNCICKCCRGQLKTSGGYRWEYVE